MDGSLKRSKTGFTLQFTNPNQVQSLNDNRYFAYNYIFEISTDWLSTNLSKHQAKALNYVNPAKSCPSASNSTKNNFVSAHITILPFPVKIIFADVVPRKIFPINEPVGSHTYQDHSLF